MITHHPPLPLPTMTHHHDHASPTTTTTLNHSPPSSRITHHSHDINPLLQQVSDNVARLIRARPTRVTEMEALTEAIDTEIERVRAWTRLRMRFPTSDFDLESLLLMPTDCRQGVHMYAQLSCLTTERTETEGAERTVDMERLRVEWTASQSFFHSCARRDEHRTVERTREMTAQVLRMSRTATALVCVGCLHCPDADRADVRDIVADLVTLGADPTVEGGAVPMGFLQEHFARGLQAGPSAVVADTMGETLHGLRRSRLANLDDRHDRLTNVEGRRAHRIEAVETDDANNDDPTLGGAAVHDTWNEHGADAARVSSTSPPMASMLTREATQTATAHTRASSTRARVAVGGTAANAIHTRRDGAAQGRSVTVVGNPRLVHRSAVAAALEAVEVAEYTAAQLAVRFNFDVSVVRNVMHDAGGLEDVAMEMLVRMSDQRGAEVAMQAAVSELVRLFPVTEDYALAVLTATGGVLDDAAALLANELGRDAALEAATEELVQRVPGVDMNVAREAMEASGGDVGAALAMLSAEHVPARTV
jgi:hypothetical protein